MNEKCKLCIHYIAKNDMGFICHYCNIKEGDKEIFELRGCEKYIRRDLVQVIRCKDCKYMGEVSLTHNGDYIVNSCGYHNSFVNKNDFCSRSERKADGT